jgi:hypothetical protein
MSRNNTMQMKILNVCHFPCDSSLCRYISLVYTQNQASIIWKLCRYKRTFQAFSPTVTCRHEILYVSVCYFIVYVPYLTFDTILITDFTRTYMNTYTYIRSTNTHSYTRTYIEPYIHIVYTYTYVRTYIHTRIYTFIYTYTHAYIHTYIHTHIHTRTSIQFYSGGLHWEIATSENILTYTYLALKKTRLYCTKLRDRSNYKNKNKILQCAIRIVSSNICVRFTYLISP